LFDLAMNRFRLPHLLLLLAALLSASAIVLLFSRKPQPRDVAPVAPVAVEADPSPAPHGEQPAPDAAPSVPSASADPAELVRRIAASLAAGDVDAVLSSIRGSVNGGEAEALLKPLADGSLRVRDGEAVREVGEMELNSRVRWSVALESADGQSAGELQFDLKKSADGRWSVIRLSRVSVGSDQPDTAIPSGAEPLDAADAFLRAVLGRDFQSARRLTLPGTVNDAKIAGLCILFEEGSYRLRANKPLRAMFRRGDLAAFLANVESADGEERAQFSLTLQAESAASWRVSEINLDSLLQDYARHVAGGDIHYSPLVVNPSVGDTIALYFGFDEDEPGPRTLRQLEIIAKLLLGDPARKITLNGHTDAMGTADYNLSLSQRRAETVRRHLVASGVGETQIVTHALGASQPRRPNRTETGEDDPLGRRVNRRTEIYLDFE
jgi:outer membrane protein OmpA-like peptidoglycan-associated protein